MISTIAIADPTTALMLAGLEVDEFGQVTRGGRGTLRRRQRRFHRHTRLRKQFA